MKMTTMLIAVVKLMMTERGALILCIYSAFILLYVVASKNNYEFIIGLKVNRKEIL